MICVVTIIRYPKYYGIFGVLSMALFHLPLWLNKNITFYKLMGSGKDGSFSKQPDWRQWAILFTTNDVRFAIDKKQRLNHAVPSAEQRVCSTFPGNAI